MALSFLVSFVNYASLLVNRPRFKISASDLSSICESYGLQARKGQNAEFTPQDGPFLFQNFSFVRVTR